MKCVDDMNLTRKLFLPTAGMLSKYVKKTNKQVRSHLKKPSQVSDISTVSPSTQEKDKQQQERKPSSIDGNLFQSDKSILSSNNIELVNSHNYETSSF